VDSEYLLSYGTAGDFGRFRPTRPFTCRRGDRAVVRTARGLELGVVLCEAQPGHARFLPNTSVGQLLRLASAADEQSAQQMQERAQRLFEASRRHAAELALPIEILDVEVLLDGEQAILHHLRWAEYDERPLVSALVREHDLRVLLHNLGGAMHEEVEEEEHGCGRPNCGKAEGGGCSTCGTGGGCSTCGTSQPEEVQAHFSELREQMLARGRTPLL